MNDDELSTVAPSAAKPASQINRLSIAHLLLWMTMTSVALVCELRNWQISPFHGQDTSDPVWNELRTKWDLARAIVLAMTPVSGAALAGAAVAVCRAIQRSRSFPVQPGHWLLVVLGAQYGNTLFGTNEIDVANGLTLKLLRACAMLLVPAIAAVFAAAYCTQRRWKVSFALFAIGYTAAAASIPILSLVSASSNSLTYVIAIPGLLFVLAYSSGLVSSIWDARSHEHRDLFHWIGCVVLFATDT